jgi:phosphoribosyl-ATP pyrophosphohydrolase/phosphoribosyl-AMP cyclohydrolase
MVEDVVGRMVKWGRDGLVGVLVVDEGGSVVGLVYMDAEALRETVRNRQLYRYSREFRKVMKKGETSDNVFNVLDIKFDCDNDSIIVVVKG